MAKPALGKGLGELMGGQQAPARKPSAGPAVAGKVTPVDFGRGLGSLVSPKPLEKPELAPTRALLPAWFFFASDVLLLAFTVAICLDASHPMQIGEVLFAAISVGLGALLSIAGVLRAADRPQG